MIFNRTKPPAPPEQFDALSGEPLTSSGWILTRRLDGQEWAFKSLTGIEEALRTGMFGVTFVRAPLVLGTTTEDAPFAEDFEEPFDAADATWKPAGASLGTIWIDEFVGGMNSPSCPIETCWGCPDPPTCAGLRTAEPSTGREPLGWNAPEFFRG